MENKPIKEKILLVEGEINLLYSLQAKLSTEGFLVDSHNGTGSAEEVINMIHITKPNYIILDLVLPGIDGFELLKTIKTNLETRRIPIFIFTNLNDRISRERSERLGAEYYFIKSDFTVDEYVAKAVKIINNLKKVGTAKTAKTVKKVKPVKKIKASKPVKKNKK